MLGLAIAGFGNIGRVHADNLATLRGCQLCGIYDLNPAALARVSHPLTAYHSYEQLLADERVDAVVIATPAQAHRDMTAAALRAGKHVFVEKPLADTLPGAQDICALAAASPLHVQVGFCERFNPQYLEAKRAVTRGALGTLRVIETSRVAPYALGNPEWALGVLDTAVHNFDLILWLKGAPPVQVQAFGAKVYPDAMSHHAITTVISFADGAFATDRILWLSDDAYALHQCARSRMHLVGTEGSFEIDLSTRPAGLLQRGSYQQIDTVLLGGPEYYGCLKLQFESFLRSIDTGVPVQAPVADALATERLAIAAHESLRSGRSVKL